MRCNQVFFILLWMGVPWVCRMEHTLFSLFLILQAFLWVYQLGHRPSWRPSDHQELTNGEPFLSSCFYCSFSLPFLFLVMSWNSNNIFLLGDTVQTDAVFTVKLILRQLVFGTLQVGLLTPDNSFWNCSFAYMALFFFHI